MKDINSLGLKIENGQFLILDQEALPQSELWLKCESPQDMIDYIKKLKIRGAPLIGVGAALAIAQFAETGAPLSDVLEWSHLLKSARPTAVNLMNAIDRMISQTHEAPLNADILVRRAEHIFNEDVALCEAIGNHGASLIDDGDSILTHCNSGGLATAGIGTALGIIRKAHEQGKQIHVYADETRPLLQGSRLSAWELHKLGIPFTLICDNMAAMLMSRRKINKIFVGADRIASNGDFANKIGTYGIAVAAAFHKIPFYTAAPQTTIDWNCKSGAEIPIEERSSSEIRHPLSPTEYQAYNPAFDVTPNNLVSGYVLDSGVQLEWKKRAQLSI